MEGYSYISYIKINGVPILPPMITEELKRDIASYKKSAIAVERKLEGLRIAQHLETKEVKSTCENRCCERNDALEILNSFACRNIGNKDAGIIDAKNIPKESFKNVNHSVTQGLHSWENAKLVSNFESQVDINPVNSSKIEQSDNRIDKSQSMNDEMSTKSNTPEIMPEIWRPQVPKTLNIVPHNISRVNYEETKVYEENKENDVHNIGNTPKLIRQGSYVLDTPSPILLAHMQMEQAISTCSLQSEYVPSSHTNLGQQKVWNPTYLKVEWQYDSKDKEPVHAESPNSLSIVKENSYASTGKMLQKSTSLHAKPKSPFAIHSSAKSADCIQTMLIKEHMEQERRDTRIRNSHKDNRNVDEDGIERCQRWKKFNSSSTLNRMADTSSSFGGTCENNNVFASNIFTAENVSEKLKPQNDGFKVKSSITSNKLLSVYKKVQEMHKKQMAELMSRQQREQNLLQKEFENQQLVLLTEIRKTFPEFSVALLAENVLSPTLKQSSPKCCDNSTGDIDARREHSANTITKNEEGKIEVKSPPNGHLKMGGCLLDYIYPEINCDNAYPAQHSFSSQPSDPMSMCSSKHSKSDVDVDSGKSRFERPESLEKKVIEAVDCKRSNVSRELFPLDSKTAHVPVPDRTIYGIKHIQAANVINAYVRGYFVRRMMQTDRVIALKNTYMEALHCMAKLHADAPLNRSEFNFLRRLQLQCDAASMNIVELFAQNPEKRMQVIAQDREIKQSRIERPASARSYSFATQRTLARKKLKEMEQYQPTSFIRSCLSRSRCQTWTSDIKERLISPSILHRSIKRSTSAGTVRKPWR